MGKPASKKVYTKLKGELTPIRKEIEGSEETPIVRIHDGGASVLNFDQLLCENEGFESFAFAVGKDLVELGHYNDSDGTSTICIYTADKPEALRRQMGAAFQKLPEEVRARERLEVP